MSDNTLGTDETSTESTETTQETTKTYTQEEMDNHMSGLKKSMIKKFEKKYEGLGDIDDLRELKSNAEQQKIDEQTSRGEFEQVLSDLAAKKDSEISKRDDIIRDYKINTPLLSAAADLNAVNVNQVKQLLSNQLRLNNDGDVEVLDSTGQVRYNDSGKAFGVTELVGEFLKSNPHFRAANPATTSTKTNIVTKGNKELDVSKLDMNKPEDRALYKEYRKTQGLS